MAQKVYISLPMKGVEDTIWSRYQSAVAYVKQLPGYELCDIIPPVDITDFIPNNKNKSTNNFSYGYYLGKDIELLCDCTDILMTETTYGDKIRQTKRIREREFIKKIEETLSRGGKVLIPIFALGRAQELCILIDSYWKRTNNKAPIYFIGPMAQKVNFYYKLFQNWMNPAVKSVFTQRNVFDFKFVQQSDKNLGDADIPMVIFATPGMLHGGFSLNLFKKMAPKTKNCVIIEITPKTNNYEKTGEMPRVTRKGDSKNRYNRNFGEFVFVRIQGGDRNYFRLDSHYAGRRQQSQRRFVVGDHNNRSKVSQQKARQKAPLRSRPRRIHQRYGDSGHRPVRRYHLAC